MTAEVLRRAATLMRERANAATPGPWVAHIRTQSAEGSHAHVGWVSTPQNRMTVVDNAWDGDVAYIASWHPVVALAVADWLEVTADDVGSSSLSFKAAEAVAYAYLGEPS